MDENSIMEALGLEGEREQEPAEPAAEETEESAPAAAETAQEESEAAPAENPVQSPEERSRQAYGRRQRELEAAVSAARAEERANVDKLLKSLGIKNPQSGEAVDTLDGLEKYERELVSRRIESGKPREDDIRRIVREETQPKQRDPQQPDPEAIKGMVDRQIAEIHTLDPAVNSLEDILNSDVGPAFRQYVAANPGKNFVDAYNAVAQSRIAARKQAAAEQTAINRINSKSHLSATAMRGQGSTPVPRDQLVIFRALMPDVPDADFERFYNRKEK